MISLFFVCVCVLQEVECTSELSKMKHHDNPFIEPVQTQTVVDMKGMYGELFLMSCHVGRHGILFVSCFFFFFD